MTIKFKCDGCGSVLKIKDELAGKAGSCPKCKAAFTIPAPEKSKRDVSESTAGRSSSAESDDDDDMFGKDFFKLGDVPTRPKFIAPPIGGDDDDDDADAPVKKDVKSAPVAKEPAPSSTDAAANVAGQLLAKTGKKKKDAGREAAEQEAIEAERQAEKMDFTEVKYQLTHKVLPIVAGGLVVAFGLYWMTSSMMGGKSKLPPLGRVSGVATLDGKPAANTELRFIPQGANPGDVAKGSFSYAITDAQGAYRLSYNASHDGAVVGKHKVELLYPGRQLIKDAEVKEGSNEIKLDF